jgi:hypothetical protein
MATSSWAEHTSVKVPITEQGGRVIHYDLDKFIGFSQDEGKLQQELLEHPAKFAYVASLFASASVRTERQQERVKVKAAELDKKIRMQAVESETRLTEDMIKNMIRTHKEYLALQEEYFTLREQEENLRALKDGMFERLKCMLAWANMFRAQRDTDPGARVDRAKR